MDQFKRLNEKITERNRVNNKNRTSKTVIGCHNIESNVFFPASIARNQMIANEMRGEEEKKRMTKTKQKNAIINKR